jgi:hypothetical protein
MREDKSKQLLVLSASDSLSLRLLYLFPLGLFRQFPHIPVCEPYRSRRSFPSDGLR